MPAAGGANVSLKLSHDGLWSEPQAPAVGVMNSPLQETVGVEGESVPDAGVAFCVETATVERASSRHEASSARNVEKTTKVLLVTEAR